MSVESKTDASHSACEAGLRFVDLFYKKVASSRHNLGQMYHENATLSFNGNRISGPQAIADFMTRQLPMQTEFTVLCVDAQPVSSVAVGTNQTVMISVAGQVLFERGGKPVPFQQNFVVTDAQGKWRVVTDVFRCQNVK